MHALYDSKLVRVILGGAPMRRRARGSIPDDRRKILKMAANPVIGKTGISQSPFESLDCLGDRASVELLKSAKLFLLNPRFKTYTTLLIAGFQH